MLALVSLVAAMAAPSLRGFSKGRKMANATAEILALSRYAYSQAIAQGQNYRLNFDEVGRFFWLTVQNGVVFQDLQTEFGRHFSLPQNTSAAWLNDGQTPFRNYVEFHPDGRTEAGTLRLADDKGRETLIGCLSQTETLRVIRPSEQGL